MSLTATTDRGQHARLQCRSRALVCCRRWRSATTTTRGSSSARCSTHDHEIIIDRLLRSFKIDLKSCRWIVVSRCSTRVCLAPARPPAAALVRPTSAGTGRRWPSSATASTVRTCPFRSSVDSPVVSYRLVVVVVAAPAAQAAAAAAAVSAPPTDESLGQQASDEF